MHVCISRDPTVKLSESSTVFLQIVQTQDLNYSRLQELEEVLGSGHPLFYHVTFCARDRCGTHRRTSAGRLRLAKGRLPGLLGGDPENCMMFNAPPETRQKSRSFFRCQWQCASHLLRPGLGAERDSVPQKSPEVCLVADRGKRAGGEACPRGPGLVYA